MRILHLCKYLPPFVGGIETFTDTLSRELTLRGHEVICMGAHEKIGMAEQLDLSYKAVKLRRYGQVLSTPMCYWSAKQINRIAPDIVHVHLPNPLPLFTLANIRAPILATLHAPILGKGLSGHIYHKLYRHQVKRFDRVITTSAPIQEHPRIKSIEVGSGQYEVIPIGIDDPRGLLSDTGEANGFVDRKSRSIIFVGRLVRYKGVDFLLQALAKTEGDLTIVGDGPERSHLQSLAHELQIQGRVKFLGSMNKSQVYKEIFKHNLLVLPSINEAEAFGVVLLEALGLGIPIISTRLMSGTSVVNQDGKTGYIIPPKDSEKLSLAIDRFFKEEKFNSFSISARKRFVENFQISMMVERYLEQYQLLLNGKEGGLWS